MSGSIAPPMKRNQATLFIVIFCCWLPSVTGTVSLIGGTISWSLDNQFEANRIVTFSMRTSWDQSLFFIPSIVIQLGNTVQFPTNTGGDLTPAGSFGQLKIMAGNSISYYPNNFVVMALDGDANTAPGLVHGELIINWTFPSGVYTANASIVQASGLPFSRQATVQNSVTRYNSGGMDPCQPLGPSPTPCQEGIFTGVATTATIDLFTTLQLPQNSTYIWNRNSPFSGLPPVMQLTDICKTEGSSTCFTNTALQPTFQFPLFDLDGDRVASYMQGTTQDGPLSQTLFCANQNRMDIFGCNGRSSDRDQPPYSISRFGFNRTYNQAIPRSNPKFYFSFTLKASDGTNIITQEFQISYCQPELGPVLGTSTVPVIVGRAPEFVTLDSAGNIVRSAPSTTIICKWDSPCSFQIYAATFADIAGTSTASAVTTNLKATGYNSGGVLRNSTRLSNGVTSATFVAGGLPNGSHTVDQIGMYWIPCFYATSNTICRSPPLCFLVKIIGSDPFFLPPTPPLEKIGDALLPDVVSKTPVCNGLTVTFGIKATDPDLGDSVFISVFDATGDGQNLFQQPFNAKQIGNYSDPHVPQVTFSYTLDYNGGISTDPVTRAVIFPPDRKICVVAIDNTWMLRKRYGSLPDGNFRSATKCYLILFAGPPVFITTPSREDGTPFNQLVGDKDQRMRIIPIYLGREASVTFRAKSPTISNAVTIFILEDPGLPNGATVGENLCEPQYLPLAGSSTLVYSNCSVSSRKVVWTPPVQFETDRLYKFCAVPRDDQPLPQCPTNRMTPEGWYGEEHCVAFKLVPPLIHWTRNSSFGNVQNVTLDAFVPCSTVFVIEARESSTTNTVNASAAPQVASPYTIRIQGVGSVSSRVAFRTVLIGRVARTELIYTAQRGDEGIKETLCVTAGIPDVFWIPVACAVINVRRCIYCLQTGDTLESVMMEVAHDLNWLRLWAANGNDDGDPVTTTIQNPDMLAKANQSGLYINVGSLYNVVDGDNLENLAATFQTTVKRLISLNPDLSSQTPNGTNLVVGQELCVIPCSNIVGPDIVNYEN